jgi:hypothetical protein
MNKKILIFGSIIILIIATISLNFIFPIGTAISSPCDLGPNYAWNENDLRIECDCKGIEIDTTLKGSDFRGTTGCIGIISEKRCYINMTKQIDCS